MTHTGPLAPRYFVVRKETPTRHRVDAVSQPADGFASPHEAQMFVHNKMLDPSKWEIEEVYP